MVDTAVANSYITTIELASAYFASDPRATTFIATPASMVWYLQRATFVIDSLKLRGRKFWRDGTQVWPNGRSKAFPREYRDGYDMDEVTGYEIVPQHVLDACCEEALAIYLESLDTDIQLRRKLQNSGVASVGFRGRSETYSPGAKDINHGMKSHEAFALISQHIAKSFPII